MQKAGFLITRLNFNVTLVFINSVLVRNKPIIHVIIMKLFLIDDSGGFSSPVQPPCRFQSEITYGFGGNKCLLDVSGSHDLVGRQTISTSIYVNNLQKSSSLEPKFKHLFLKN